MARHGIAGDEQAQAKLRAHLKDRRAALVEDLRAVASTDAGRHVLWHLIEDVGRLFGPSFVAGDPHTTAYAEGRRAFAHDLLEMIKTHCPGQYVEMMREALALQSIERSARQEAEKAAEEDTP